MVDDLKGLCAYLIVDISVPAFPLDLCLVLCSFGRQVQAKCGAHTPMIVKKPNRIQVM